MAKIDGFNTSDYQANLQPIPKGDYSVIIQKSDVMDTKSGSGRYLNLEAKVVEGEHAGHPLTIRLNCWNNSEKAASVGRSQLKGLCLACGFANNRDLKDSAELHNIKFAVSLDVTDDGKYNEVKGFAKYTPPLSDCLKKDPEPTQTGDAGAPW